MRKLAVVFVVLTCAALGCANDNEANPTAAPAASSSANPVTAIQGRINNHGQKNFTTENFSLELEADNEGSDFYFKPTFIKAPGGSTAKIEFKNEGDVEHNLTIQSLDVSEDLEPGESKELTLKLGTDSFVAFFCKYHKTSGMQGAFSLH